MIEVSHLTKKYTSKKGTNCIALNDVSITLPDHGLIFIVGKSGSGKTTLLNMLGGLDKFDTGDIKLDFMSKSVKNFTNKEYDLYRNKYVGFIFQDFNLLDELDVVSNIKLSLRIQNKKIEETTVNTILELVELSNLRKRKINELSGGQQQRVAIARALIKNPKIILADEPTGALDSNTGLNIMTLLKKISMQRLVIVVSHDLELAKSFSDRIITISDGKIIEDKSPNNDNLLMNLDSEKQKVKNSNISFLTKLHFSFINLFKKRIRLIFSIVSITISLILLALSRTMANIDVTNSYSNTMINENENRIEILKTNAFNDQTSNYYKNDNIYYFNSTDIKTIIKKTSIPYIEKKVINENNGYISFEFDNKKVKDNSKIAYYGMIYDKNYFVDISSVKEMKKIIGKYPSNSNEIIIEKYLADYIIENSIVIYKYNDNNRLIESFFTPKDYNDLIENGKNIKLGSLKINIVGIVDNELNNYSYLKEEKAEDFFNRESDLFINKDLYNYLKFINSVMENSKILYVNKDFFDYANESMQNNYEVNQEIYSMYALYNNSKEEVFSSIFAINKKLTIYDGKKKVTIDSLQDNEIIIDSSFINSIFSTSNKSFNELWKQYMNNYKNEEKEYENIFKSGRIPAYEFKYYDDEELYIKFLDEYLKDNENFLEKFVDIEILPQDKFDDNSHPLNLSVKIVGINLDDGCYFNQQAIRDAMTPKIQIESLLFLNLNDNEISKMLSTFPINDSKYYNKTVFSDSVLSVKKIIEKFEPFAFYASIVFGIFSVILITNFLSTSIIDNKIQIGILRALGFRKKDVFEIFVFENLVIVFFALILSLFSSYLLCDFFNSIISNNLNFNFEILKMSKDIVLMMLFGIIIVTLFVSQSVLSKISKLKPIDIIYNRK